MNSHEWAYLAGLLDADGSVSVRKYKRKDSSTYKYHVECVISNSDNSLMDWLVTKLGGGVLIINKKAPQKHKTVWRWVVTGRKVIPILEKCIPHMIVKKQRARLGLQFAETLSQFPLSGKATPDDVVEMRDYIVTQIKRMNHRGRMR